MAFFYFYGCALPYQVFIIIFYDLFTKGSNIFRAASAFGLKGFWTSHVFSEVIPVLVFGKAVLIYPSGPPFPLDPH